MLVQPTAHNGGVPGLLGLDSEFLTELVSWAFWLIGAAVLVLVIWLGWHYIRGDVAVDDPRAPLGPKLFGRWRKPQRPEDWLRKKR
jgi:hypothetical protein